MTLDNHGASLPALGTFVTFVPQDADFPFTGRVVRSYGFAVAVAALGPEPVISVLEIGVPYVVVPSN